MRSARFLFLPFAIATFVVSPAFDWQRMRDGNRNPKELLLRSMKYARRYALASVVVQKFGFLGNAEVELKVEQDGAGTTRITTWSPSWLRGNVSIDDGSTWYTYEPRRKLITKQPSPRVTQENPNYQVALADENYRWKLEKTADIADRPTVCVVAIPNAKELPTRKYYLDEYTSVMMRQEAISSDNTKTVYLDTRAIAYLKPTTRISPDADLEKQYTVITVDPPERIMPHSSAKSRVRFTPVIPDKLPFGFIVRDVELVGRREQSFLAIRLSDGLVTCTVYQWNAKDPPKRLPKRFKQDSKESKGVRFVILGDVPSVVGSKIVKVFLK